MKNTLKKLCAGKTDAEIEKDIDRAITTLFVVDCAAIVLVYVTLKSCFSSALAELWMAFVIVYKTWAYTKKIAPELKREIMKKIKSETDDGKD